MKTRFTAGVLVLAVIALVSGAAMLALAAPGSQEDPFITVNYLNEVFKQQIMAEANHIGQQYALALDAKIAEMEDRIRDSLGGAAQIPGSIEVFSVVTLSNGQSLTCSVGAEIMLRIGSASAFGSDPALVDYTSGETLSSGSVLAHNHMYLVTIEGNGIRATADTVRVLVRGNYRVG